MNKYMLNSLLLVGVPLAMTTITKAAAADGTINFTGNVTDQTCTVVAGSAKALLIKSKVGWSLPNPPGGLS
ncbi:hypothetical protein AN664_0224650 [Serratia marcescens]|nr:hypothetical protein AN701_0225330 [Serratia marcescens]OCN34421.1 hypothetical protein AN658_0224720 [Serratia marcescens]OCN35248.1 hypothetical protein AN660_0225100 [Serratia marcescens]OCN55247.1 hypothetical protein AN665_0224290 [Serratia marcescens]OCN55644.1 hypothetical protein AN664_0224650 [Serratia marcescens]